MNHKTDTEGLQWEVESLLDNIFIYPHLIYHTQINFHFLNIWKTYDNNHYIVFFLHN